MYQIPEELLQIKDPATFVHASTRFVATNFDVAYSVLGVLSSSAGVSKTDTSRKMLVLSAYSNKANQPIDNFVYDLEGTPCYRVVMHSHTVCCYPDNIVELFPQDKILKDMAARSYIGTPLRASGKVIGLFALMDEKSIPEENIPMYISVMGIFASVLSKKVNELLNTPLAKEKEENEKNTATV